VNTESSLSRTICLTSGGGSSGGGSLSLARMNSGTGERLSANPQAESASAIAATGPKRTMLPHIRLTLSPLPQDRRLQPHRACQGRSIIAEIRPREGFLEVCRHFAAG
jgi:hypothetical protein